VSQPGKLFGEEDVINFDKKDYSWLKMGSNGGRGTHARKETAHTGQRGSDRGLRCVFPAAPAAASASASARALRVAEHSSRPRRMTSPRAILIPPIWPRSLPVLSISNPGSLAPAPLLTMLEQTQMQFSKSS
jgi:hypothetical protein